MADFFVSNYINIYLQEIYSVTPKTKNMSIKLILFGVLFFSGIGIVVAQDAEIKDNMVIVNGKEILKFEKVNAFDNSFYSLDGTEILLYRWNNNETPHYVNDDFFILNFLTAKKKIESASTPNVLAGMGLNNRKNMQKLVNWLLKEKVLDAEGKINLEKLEIFYDKYNENITARTIRN